MLKSHCFTTRITTVRSCIHWNRGSVHATSRSLFISRVDKSATEDHPRMYMEQSNVDIRELKCLSHSKSNFRTFKLTVPVNQWQLLIYSNRWPSVVSKPLEQCVFVRIPLHFLSLLVACFFLPILKSVLLVIHNC